MGVIAANKGAVGQINLNHITLALYKSSDGTEHRTKPFLAEFFYFIDHPDIFQTFQGLRSNDWQIRRDW